MFVPNRNSELWLASKTINPAIMQHVSVSLQLNHQDEKLLSVKKFVNGNSINIEVDHELERGEFRIVSGRSSFLKSLNDS